MTSLTPISRCDSLYREPISIKEDSNLLRIICCTPFLGTIASIFIQLSLDEKWSSTKNEPLMIELLHIKNQYKVADVIRNLINVAIMVASIAYKIIPLTSFQVAWISLLLTASALSMHARSENMKVISEIETTGYKEYMKIW